MKKLAKCLLPWIITLIALYFAFKDLQWTVFFTNILRANHWYLLAICIIGCASYSLRAFRWKYFFPLGKLKYIDALKVLLLGFFMNNILPARAGEFVRAHLGAKKFLLQRTLVLATIASERLVDGLMISFIFLLIASNSVGGKIGKELYYVAILFFVVGIGILCLLLARKKVFSITDKLHNKVNNRVSDFLNSRLQVFIEGLKPIYQPSRFPFIFFTSATVWLIELSTYALVCEAFSVPVSWTLAVAFMVAVNFSSLIPSAPGAIGVIEVITALVLESLGVQKETALSMVITIHIIQYLVVGIPGLYLMLRWDLHLNQMKADAESAS